MSSPTLFQTVRKVEKLYADLANDLSRFQHKNKLRCIDGCNACCHKPDIESSVLEMLPFAYHLFRENKAASFLEKLKPRMHEPICLLLLSHLRNGQKGFCGNYENRPLICRLFGFSAMLDKNHKPVIVTCKIIKESQPEPYHGAVQMIGKGEFVPVISNYFQKMRNIDPELGVKMLPINTSMCKAIEYVLSYYQYRRRPVGSG